jgi:hypothetical protein
MARSGEHPSGIGKSGLMNLFHSGNVRGSSAYPAWIIQECRAIWKLAILIN